MVENMNIPVNAAGQGVLVTKLYIYHNFDLEYEPVTMANPMVIILVWRDLAYLNCLRHLSGSRACHKSEKTYFSSYNMRNIF